MVSRSVFNYNYRLRQGIILPPETKATLRGYKQPLTRVLEGYGFIGTLAYNLDKTHVQCHVCGNFFKMLTKHVMRVHGMEKREYQDRFSLMRSTPLTSPVSHARIVERRTQLSLVPATREQLLKNLEKGRTHNRRNLETLESKNRKGRCPEQLLRKVLVLSEELQKTPTRREFIAKHGDNGDLASIYRTFGSWSTVIKELGMEPNKKGRIAISQVN